MHTTKWSNDNDCIADTYDDFLQKNVEYPVNCPICSKKQAHLYIYEYNEKENKGACWTWCSNCYNFYHWTQSDLPTWWENDLDINFDKLGYIPTYLNSIISEVDSYMNDIQKKRR